MNTQRFYILFSLLLCFINKGYSQGLQFYGNEKRIADRSSFCVFTDKNIPDVTSTFTISFEYAAQNIESSGYIFYLKDFNGQEAFNLTYVYDTQQVSFMFAQDGKQIYYTHHDSRNKLHGKWMPISLEIDLTNNRVEISIDNDKAVLEDIGFNKRSFTPQLFFGMCDHILETASFSIRNLKISNHEETWNFPLNESSGEDVHDSEGRIIGCITNPTWLINRSYYWKPLFLYYSSTPSGFAFATEKQEFYIYNQDSIITYNIYKRTSEKRCYMPPKEASFLIRLGMNFYDETQSKIYAYELNGAETFIAEMNPQTKTWEMINQNGINLQMHHHSGIFNPQKEQFLLFGGYGNRQYYNTFITYDLKKERWDTLHFAGDEISPRFFAGITMSPDYKRAYIYGGKGNESGDQNVGIQYYYDLYQLDIDTKQIKKLWEHRVPQINRIPTRDMILSEDGKYIYLLAYPEYKPQTQLQLYRLSISDGSCEALGNSIPLTSEEIATNANLYFNRELGEFYCVIQEFEKYGESATRIYSLSSPPISLTTVMLYDKQGGDKDKSFMWLYLVFIVCIAGVGSIFVSIKHRQLTKKKKHQNKSISSSQENAFSDTDVESIDFPSALETTESEEMEETFLPNAITTHKNSISLFGTFTVIDKNGRDMTYMFSPKIRHIFLFILINSIAKDGVLSSDMNSLFWPDKPDDKIKNLKNVTMNHLRKTLQELEGIELTHQKGYFKLVFTDECHCDYNRFFHLTNGMKCSPLAESETIVIHNILAQGKFLSTIEDGLFDYSKQQVETFTIALLSKQINTSYKSGRNSATIRFCNILFAIDPLSDIAMTYALCTNRRQGRADKAIQLYGTFTKEYRKVMNEDYPIAFDEVNTDNIRL